MVVNSFTLTEESAKVKAFILYPGKIATINEVIENNIRELHVIFEDGNEIDFSPFFPDGKFSSVKDKEGVFIEIIEKSLVWVNLIIIIFSTVVGFFLAGATMLPIKKKMMKEEAFIQNAAHELRNPLTSIKIICQTQLREKYSREWREVLDETNRLISLNEDLFTLSGKQDGAKTEIFLKSLIEQVAKTLSPLLHKKNISFELTLDEFTITGIKSDIEKIIFNLLHNAIKFSLNNGIIKVALGKDGVFTVQDFGIGISKEELPKIFERFYKGDTSRQGDEGGSGLGLAIVKETLVSRKGSIRVRSILGKGTIFTVKFKQ